MPLTTYDGAENSAVSIARPPLGMIIMRLKTHLIIK